MTQRQKRFCEEYLIDVNATQAAMRAGYSPKNAGSIGYRNLRHPEISSYIARRMEEKQSELIASQDEVLQFLTQVLRGEQLEEKLVTSGGKASVVTFCSQSNRVRAAELLGKRYALFSERAAPEEQSPVVIVDDIAEEKIDEGG